MEERIEMSGKEIMRLELLRQRQAGRYAASYPRYWPAPW